MKIPDEHNPALLHPEPPVVENSKKNDKKKQDSKKESNKDSDKLKKSFLQ